MPLPFSINGQPVDAAGTLIPAAPGLAMDITIPKQNSFYLTDVTVSNSSTILTSVIITEGSGGKMKETIALAGAVAMKIGYITPKIFGTIPYVYANSASVVDITISGVVGLQGQSMLIGGQS